VRVMERREVFYKKHEECLGVLESLVVSIVKGRGEQWEFYRRQFGGRSELVRGVVDGCERLSRSSIFQVRAAAKSAHKAWEWLQTMLNSH
jgi:hypothetical protein